MRSLVKKRAKSGPSAAAKGASAKEAIADEAPFGPAYFRRYYFSRATRVIAPVEMRVRATLIATLLRQCGVPVGSVLDAGCGIGSLRAPFAKLLPRATYTGLERSEYLCKRYGWVKGSLVDFTPGRHYDLVVCYDVLQYLDNRLAARAIANLARLAANALYISALTVEDWRHNCDQTLTDSAVHLRPAEWYRRRLSRRFRHLGFGVWVRRGTHASLWELERPVAALSRAPKSSRPALDAPLRPRRRPPAGR